MASQVSGSGYSEGKASNAAIWGELEDEGFTIWGKCKICGKPIIKLHPWQRKNYDDQFLNKLKQESLCLSSDESHLKKYKDILDTHNITICLESLINLQDELRTIKEASTWGKIVFLILTNLFWGLSSVLFLLSYLDYPQLTTLGITLFCISFWIISDYMIYRQHQKDKKISLYNYYIDPYEQIDSDPITTTKGNEKKQENEKKDRDAEEDS